MREATHWSRGGERRRAPGFKHPVEHEVERAQSGWALGSGPRVGGSNPLAPTNFLEKLTEFSLVDHSVPSEWSVPQIALGAGIQAQKRCYGPRIVRLLLKLPPEARDERKGESEWLAGRTPAISLYLAGR